MAKKAARAPKRSATPARRAARKSTPARKAAPRKAAAPLRKSAARATTTAKAAKYVYSWGAGKADGNGTMKPLLGGKGANLAEMAPHRAARAGRLHDHDRGLHVLLRQQAHLPGGAAGADRSGHRARSEKIMGAKFGDATKFPLLVAVRSGARDSMPGMMDTILNLGLNDETVIALERATQQPALRVGLLPPLHPDVRRRGARRAEARRRGSRAVRNGARDATSTRPTATANSRTTSSRPTTSRAIVERFKALVKERTGKAFPSDPWQQLEGAVSAVFGSWMNDRAIVYRRKYNIPAEWGTAVNVQAMVFGNTGDESGSGVAFTRDPATGEKVFYGEFLLNAQGEDVVAGVRTPEPVAELAKQMPKAYKELDRIRKVLETHFKDMQDFEFTIQDGKVYMLQTRNGKRTGVAAVRIATEMVKEGLIDWKTAVMRVPADQLESGAGADLRSRRGQEGAASSPRVCRPVPARPPARSTSTPIAPWKRRRRARRCCSSASRPRPRTCAA